jgi:isochorismate hydrolase
MTFETFERDYAAFLASDMLAQFQDKPHTTALLNALARQLDDYMRVCK